MSNKEKKYYFEKFKQHIGHSVTMMTYGITSKEEDTDNIAIECLDCNEVLIDFDKEDE